MKKENCKHWGNVTGVYLPKIGNAQEQKNQEIIENLKRVWLALRRQLGRNEILMNDFKKNAEEILTNSVYNGPIDENIIQNIINS
jgi:hypothetical protein